MIDRIIHFSVYNRTAVLIATAAIATLGWFQFRDLPIDATPDVTNNQVQINTPVDGLSPEETERNVTFPIETAVRGLAGVTEVRSMTRFNLSQVTVIFEDDVEIYRARQLVAERLQSLAGRLPKGALPQPGPVSSGLGEIVHYAIEPERPAAGAARAAQLMEIRTLQEWFVKPRLLTVKGVAEVNTIGGLERQYHVQPNAQKMAHYGLAFPDLIAAIEKTNQNVGGGYVQQTAEQFLVQAVGLFGSPEDIKAVPLKSLSTFKTLTIGDVADVRAATQLRSGAALVDGHETVVGTVMMLLSENSRTVAKRVGTRLREIEASLPKGYRIKELYNRSELVNHTLATVEHNLLTGAVLVIIVLALLMGHLRAALITALTIPLSLLFSFIVMRYLGISGNLMSLGALDFGIIVDGTVILLDHCVRLVHERTVERGRTLTAAELKRTVYEAAVEIRTAAGFGELIIVVVFLPVFALVGTEGKMFRPMAATFIIAILAALIISFTMGPALASLLLTGRTTGESPWLMRKLASLYGPVLDQILNRKKLFAAAGVTAAAAGVALFTTLGGEFLPQLDEGTLLVQTTRPVNINLDQSIELQAKTEILLAEFPEVAFTFSKLGTSSIANDPMGVNQADTYVIFKPESEWPRAAGSRDEIARAMIERLRAEIPGQSVLRSQPIQMRFNDLLEGSKADVSLKIFGDDLGTLAKLTARAADVIRALPGSGEVEAEMRGTSPLLRITPKRGLLRQLGLPTRRVLETIGIAMGGGEAGFLYDGIKRYPILVQMSEEQRSDLDAIRNLPVGTGENMTTPLHEVAEVRFDQTYGTITRENGLRRGAVMINPRGRDTEGFVREAHAAVAARVPLPDGYFVEWAGSFKNLREARARLLVLAPLAMLLVVLMIYAAFRNVFQTALVFACVPMALIGGVIGLLINRLPFSISAGVGFIALSGIAVLNGVVLMNYFNQLAARGRTGREVAREGTLLRLRPVLMTALVDIFGFLPMMLSTKIGAEVQKPLAAVVIGGIASSTILTLAVLPALYLIFERRFSPPAPGGA